MRSRVSRGRLSGISGISGGWCGWGGRCRSWCWRCGRRRGSCRSGWGMCRGRRSWRRIWEDVRQARMADLVFSPSSLDAPLADRPDAGSLADVLGAEDPGMELALDMQALSSHWGELPRREQRILLMRFYGDMTQAQIGERLGISQMHVSRLLARALGYLRERLLGPAGPAAAPRRAPRRLEPVLAFEDEVKRDGSDDHDAGGDGQARRLAEAGIRHVHAIEARDERRHRDDGRPAGDLLGDDVHAVALDGEVGLQDGRD